MLNDVRESINSENKNTRERITTLAPRTLTNQNEIGRDIFPSQYLLKKLPWTNFGISSTEACDSLIIFLLFFFKYNYNWNNDNYKNYYPVPYTKCTHHISP